MMLSERYQALVDKAKDASRNAYAPYSGFAVGAAILTDTGETFVGVNVENASYPAGICAERAALAAAVSNGHQCFEAIAIFTPTPAPTPPCGICRQMLVEFSPKMQVISLCHGEALIETTLAALLPGRFDKDSLS